jgi:NAD-dependent dihydropyrimidine dehydrogenase PreA subunit
MFDAYAVNTLTYHEDACNGCAMCVAVCPHSVFEMQDRKAQLIRPSACMECGACQLNCVTGAIAVESGVGCASAMLWAALRGKTEAECNCG